jgi:hypothetical protein
VGLERGPLSLVSTVEELLGRKSSSYADHTIPSLYLQESVWQRISRTDKVIFVSMPVWSGLQITTQKWVLVITFIFSFTAVLFKICQCFTATFVPKLEDLVLRYGGNKVPAKVFDSNFLLLVCRLGRAPWQTTIVAGWRGYVRALKKSGTFRDSAQNRLQISAGICMMNYSQTLTSTHTFHCSM